MPYFNFSRLIPMTGKVVVFLVIALLLFNLSNEGDKNFVELPALEIVHAGSGSYSDPMGETESELIKEKEKIIKDFIIELKEREKALDLREKELDAKRENLGSVRKDIEKRLEELKIVKAGIEKKVDEQKAVNEANITKLAKVYESTPPEQAGPMLSGLDAEISAQIVLKMNNMKAGKIWGFVDPEKAVLISKELTKYRDVSRLKSGVGRGADR